MVDSKKAAAPKTKQTQLKIPDSAAHEVNNVHNEQPIDNVLAIIAKAATDPNCDVDKMERLMAMQERMMDRDAETTFNADFAQMQSNMPIIEQNGKLIHKGNHIADYAKFEDINEAVKPVLTEYGFAMIFQIESTKDSVGVMAILTHRAGHSIKMTMTLPIENSGAKNNVQAIGSSTSYGKRYSMCALLNITTGGVDDDGAASAAKPPLEDWQVDSINALLKDKNHKKPLFMDYIKDSFDVDRVADIPSDKFDEVISRIEAKPNGTK